MDYSYTRERITPENSGSMDLSILVSKDGFSFYLCSRSLPFDPVCFFSKQIETTEHLNLFNELNDYKEFDRLIFNRSVIVFHTGAFSIVPDEFYSAWQHEQLLFLTSKRKEGIVHLVSRSSEMNLNVIFEMPGELFDSLVSRFPGIRIIHSACPSMHFGYREKGPACIIYHYGSSISLCIISDHKLKLFNIFTVQNENDLVYFTSNALRNCNIPVQGLRLYIMGRRDSGSPDFELMKRYITEPSHYKPDYAGNNELNIPENLIFNHLEGLFCES
jgi:hypothetical protein